ncbi:low temperature requirement protein A [Kribbella albertanoniae]|uniref:Low temperature requirement protein A n=2 Tax=Kribbella albertanoniae TaxID=1266829 RepID=A0A4R4P7M1_9ACTN|nr:low temperature requirement protein A [Kribbella albertanoniae]
MRPRDPQEPGRTASTLELFFDLVFVVAVSVAAAQLHHALSEDHIAHGVQSFVIVFFAIWWAWMNFTWFATSFATDDWLYRVLTILQMGGVLVLAAGIERVYADEDFRVVVVGYVVMRVSMIAQWLRASRSPQTRRLALTYAGGIAIVQVLWIALMFLPHEVTLIGWLVLVIAEIAVPVVAERRGEQTTPRHPHHITERYGLFTLILLGESLLASANAIIKAVHEHEELPPLIAISVLTLLVTAAMWWIYFWPPHHHAITTFAKSMRYGYVHFFVFAAAGAFSAGVEAQIDVITHHSKLSEFVASFTMTVPIALFVLGIWWIALRQNADRVVNIVVPLGAVLVLFDPIVPVPFIVTTVLMVAIVVTLVVRPPITVGGEQ